MDSYTKVTSKGYGSRIMESIKGIVLGLIFFIASFFVLWINEGGVDMSEIAKTSVEVGSENVDTTYDGKLVSVTGKITSQEMIGDNLYLKPANYIAVFRNVEMYSWKEVSESDSDTSMGGTETTTTTYSYSKEWAESPANSSSFERQEGHHNPEKLLESNTNTVIDSNIGAYNINTQAIRLPSLEQISLTEEKINIENSGSGGIQFINGYLFNGKGSIGNPEVGDIRISYNVLKDGISVTAMGKQSGEEMTSFSDKDGNKLHRIFHGTRDDAISTLRTEYLVKLWGLRLLGFILMWAGLSMLLGPISVILSVLPLAGSIGKGIIGLITFVVALVLSVITIVISMIFHNIYALIIVVALIGYFIFKTMKKKMKPMEEKMEK